MTTTNPTALAAAQHQDGILSRLTEQRTVRPCGCVLYGCRVVSPCDFCASMNAGMEAEAEAWARLRPGYPLNND